MKTFKLKSFDGEINPNCTNIVYCTSEIGNEPKDGREWKECNEDEALDLELSGFNQLYMQFGVRYFGKL